MDRVTADANIYISAFEFRGKPAELLTLAAQRRIELAISDHIVEEVTRTLRNKFDWPEDRIEGAKRMMGRFTRRVVPTKTTDAIKADLSDNRILDCAAAAGSDYIVTGDAHLLRLRQYQGIKIIRVADFLRLLEPGRGR